MVGVMFRSSMEGNEPRRYFERDRFLADIVFSHDFLSKDTGRHFVGFWVPEAFRQVSIRERTNVNENAFFEHFYTAQ